MRESVEYIYGIPKFSKKASVDNTREMLRRLGNPQNKCKVIHVAGTNGKGSVCAYINRILREQGRHTGLFTSPHLVTMNERIIADDTMISDRDFDMTYSVVREISEAMVADGYAHPSFFEFLYGMAMYYFGLMGVEYIVLETGLGGRLDATNSVDAPIITIITSISLDHTDILGDTYAAIAQEKAGIIKKGVPVVYMDKRADVTEVICRKAASVGAPAIGILQDDIRDIQVKDKYIDFSINNEYYCSICFSIRSAGIYQTENAALAAVAAAVAGLGDEKAVKAGLLNARWQGRMQEVEPGLILDGAHNDDGIMRFLESVGADGWKGRRILLFSAVSDKHYDGMIREICQSKLFDRYYAGALADPRGLDIDTIRKTFNSYTDSELCAYSSVGEALGAVRVARDGDTRIYAAGSLYLVGEIMGLLQKGD